jgi:ABC-type transport system substrate-binding protein
MMVSVMAVFPTTQVAEAQAEPFILNVGVQDEMKTRNLLRVNYITTDVWTADVLGPTLDSTVQVDPETNELLPYVMAGTDVNGNGALDPEEVGVFRNTTGQQNNWTAFFDLRGLRFHDGTQVEKEDLLFSYQLEGLSPSITSSRFVKDKAGETGTNYTSTRWLWVLPVPVTGWLGGPVADPQYQVAFYFKQTGPNAQFSRDTLQTSIVPAYFWQGTGVRKQNGTIVETNIHPDFGWAVNPETLNGVPVAGVTLSQATTFEGIDLPAGTVINPFDLTTASEWDAQDEDVIGSGPFRFDTWEPGVIARVVKNPDYFTSSWQATLDAGIRVPKLDAMVYRLFRNVQAGIFALQAGTVDFLDWFVPPTFVGPLLADPNVGIITSADIGFFYVSYNFRLLPFGYADPAIGSDDPANDIGKPFRRAVAHAIDKGTIVRSLLQNFGVPGHTVVSPVVTQYYNASAPRYEFDLDLAASILDDAYGPDPPGECLTDGSGCRNLPGFGTSLMEILTPQADYDPIRAAAGTLIAQNLRTIGVNINAKPTAFGRIVDAVFFEWNFDMWILGWSIGSATPPDYIEAFFHSRSIDPAGGDNPEGYRNSSLDAIIDAAVGATDPDEAIRLWKWAQGVVAEDLAYDVLYFRTNIFAFRQDKIDKFSWRTDAGGDIFTYWSWILVDPAPPGAIRISASAPSAVTSGGTADIVVTVRDPEGNVVPGTTVDLSVASGPGSVSPAQATTDANGQVTATFTAPTLNPGDTEVASFIDVAASHPDFGAALSVSVVITTFPPGAQFLTLLVDMPFGNVVNEGATTVLDVAVSDETGLPASGADVVLTPTPSVTLTPDTFTTDASGRQTVTFSAPDVDADTPYSITISASRQGVEGSTQVTVTVLDVPAVAGPGIDPTSLLVVGAIVFTGAAGGIYVGLRRRRKS